MNELRRKDRAITEEEAITSLNKAEYGVLSTVSENAKPYCNNDDGVAKVIYTSKDRKSGKVFNALDWLARLVTHIPGRYEHTVRY